MAVPAKMPARSGEPQADADHYGPYIARAVATEGGHLMVGAYGFTLWFGWSRRLSGGDPEAVRAACLAAGLPVIDTSGLGSAVLASLIPRLPLVAVGEAADPPPWHGLSRAPLAHVAGFYRAAGAVVLNLPPSRAVSAGEGEAG